MNHDSLADALADPFARGVGLATFAGHTLWGWTVAPVAGSIGQAVASLAVSATLAIVCSAVAAYAKSWAESHQRGRAAVAAAEAAQARSEALLAGVITALADRWGETHAQGVQAEAPARSYGRDESPSQ
jgi:hypothetical protein